ncbi:hypothetical protein SVAN01_04894 [Stagonosporopsis vannaccii]|nr:hypothetical protein SVAN01_04894 [Stagonosporopsis vannaccii]
MSKRPLFPASNPIEVPTCLDYPTWKARRRFDASDERNSGQVYDYRTEDLPDEPYYNLDLAILAKNIVHMCEDLGRAAATNTSTDEGISDLRKTLKQATSIPRPKSIVIAVVGNQGVGKSSTINALLNRNLVEVIGGSEACTAFATIIGYKDGADDNTGESDIKVMFLSPDEIRDFIEEHVRRYAESVTRSSLHHDDESEAEEPDSSTQFSMYEERRAISKAVQQGADTAEEFFRIMFNADLDQSADAELQQWLQKPGLGDGRFQQHLMQLATSHLSCVQGEEGGCLEYNDVPDKDLEHVRSWSKMWPLVKSVTISTGSVLLRHGLCLMDLPGYGDLNQTRTAVVNQFRRTADFEMIVANSERYLTKSDEEFYLSRAIQQRGAENVFLVLNKIDIGRSCLSMPDVEVRQKLKKRDYKVEPFLTIKDNMAATARLGFSSVDVSRYRQYLVREAQMAFCQHECDKIARKVQRKGVKTFQVSAGQYHQWVDPQRLRNPSYKPEETGIPRLRKALLALAAAPNYKDLSTHTFEMFSDIEDKVARILEKFRDDVNVVRIRRHLLLVLPNIGQRMRMLASTVTQELVPEVWDHIGKHSIASKMNTLIDSSFRNTHYQTFSLMLRNNGFAIGSQRYSHRNLNRDFLKLYKPQLKTWKNSTILKAESLCRSLDDLVQTPLTDVQKILDVTPDDPMLKSRANKELKKLHRRIEMAQDRLLFRLEGAVHENYRHFTIEDDIKCPIALYLKEAYIRVDALRRDEARRVGTYQQQRAELLYTTNTSNDGKPALLDTIPLQIKRRQCQKWQAISNDFISEVLARFEAFTRIMQDLVENEAYTSNEHKLIRERLSEQLPQFRKSLEVVQGMFPGSETQQVAKRSCRATPMSSCFGGLARFGSVQPKWEPS